MESLEHFQQSRAVIEDLTSRTLAAIHTDFGRLHYLSSLKDPATGHYEHDGLKRIYPEGSVQSAILHCHEELFSRILETPLEDQQRDFRTCLQNTGNEFKTIIETWQQINFFRTLCPEGMPEYLNDLFCSNMTAIISTSTSSADHIH
jgi:hypothetical protein